MEKVQFISTAYCSEDPKVEVHAVRAALRNRTLIHVLICI
jgi:hypothetical protein